MSCDNRSLRRLFTVGHSNHEIGQFVELLQSHHVTALADVRSHPYSRFNSHFNREGLEAVLRQHDIGYVFLGTELGARREERECYVDRKARYELIAQTPAFQEGLARIRRSLADHHLALMCAEKDPLTCHRMILVCRHLRADPIEIMHILEEGGLESMKEAEDRLLDVVGMSKQNLFSCKEELVEDAYDKQGEKIAYVETQPSPSQIAAM